MPIYEYECPKCGIVEVLQPVNSEKPEVCPNCQKEPVDKVMSNTSYPKFKGSGWYDTDYKKKT